MDPFRKDDIDRAKRLRPEERLQAALDAVNTGVRIRWAALRAKFPAASDEDIDAALREWLKHERADD
ncbi:MAG: hypothetical protein IPK82_30100 [Polyangiaceae bacterium]|nr:hypothetical protein [Polyangiaceae bacterium]